MGVIWTTFCRSKAIIQIEDEKNKLKAEIYLKQKMQNHNSLIDKEKAIGNDGFFCLLPLQTKDAKQCDD
jgi:hypothetical protein